MNAALLDRNDVAIISSRQSDAYLRIDIRPEPLTLTGSYIFCFTS
jgi:hypothetical protein